jgi:hypothetical protein
MKIKRNRNEQQGMVITHINPELYHVYPKSVRDRVRSNPFIPIGIICYEYSDKLVFVDGIEGYYVEIDKEPNMPVVEYFQMVDEILGD